MYPNWPSQKRYSLPSIFNNKTTAWNNKTMNKWTAMTKTIPTMTILTKNSQKEVHKESLKMNKMKITVTTLATRCRSKNGNKTNSKYTDVTCAD